MENVGFQLMYVVYVILCPLIPCDLRLQLVITKVWISGVEVKRAIV
jgi:hypothetical protein